MFILLKYMYVYIYLRVQVPAWHDGERFMRINPITPTVYSGGTRTNSIINPITPTVYCGGTRTNNMVCNVSQEVLQALYP